MRDKIKGEVFVECECEIFGMIVRLKHVFYDAHIQKSSSVTLCSY